MVGEDREWRKRECLRYKQDGNIIKPQYALERCVN